MAIAFKSYLLIDHQNDRYVFINNIADSEAWFVQNNVNMANIPTDANGVPTTLQLINLATGASVPIRLVIRAAELQIVN
jgi:hypothetical protein